MTTKVRVVNFGPEVVEVETTSGQKQEVYQQQSRDFYVHSTEELKIKEVLIKKEKIKNVNSSSESI